MNRRQFYSAAVAFVGAMFTMKPLGVWAAIEKLLEQSAEVGIVEYKEYTFIPFEATLEASILGYPKDHDVSKLRGMDVPQDVIDAKFA